MSNQQYLHVICVICQETLVSETSPEITASTVCGHAFHSPCIKEWFRVNTKLEWARVIINSVPRWRQINGLPEAQLTGECPNCKKTFVLPHSVRLYLSTAEDTEKLDEKERLEAEVEATAKKLDDAHHKISSLEASNKELLRENLVLKLGRKSLDRAVASANNNDDYQASTLTVSSSPHVMKVNARVRGRKKADTEEKNESSNTAKKATGKKPNTSGEPRRKGLKETQPAATVSSPRRSTRLRNPVKWYGVDE